MRQIIQGSSHTVMLKAFLASDHITPATGKTIAIQISKAGGAFANPNAGPTNATEIANGWYKVDLNGTDTATYGDLVVRGTESTIDPAEQICQTVEQFPSSEQFVGDMLTFPSGVDFGWTMQEALRMMLAVLAGPTSGMGTTSGVIRNPGDTRDRITVTIDANGNRSSITYDKAE